MANLESLIEPIISWLSKNATNGVIQIAVALGIFIIGKIIAGLLTNFLKKIMLRRGADAMLVNFIGNITYVILISAVILAAIDSLGVNVTSLMAIIAATGLAIGLALKDSLSNFAAGVMLIVIRPFKVGDLVTAGDSKGVVDEIGLFATMMHTTNNEALIVPNSSIITGTIINEDAFPIRRISICLGISYNENITAARAALLEVIKADKRILEHPEAKILVSEFADSSINLLVRTWVKTDEYWPIYWDLLERIKVKFDEEGISIPFPQRDVHLHHVTSKSPE